MTDETTQQGASGFNANPPTNRAFPQDARVLDNGEEGGDNEEPKVSERDRVIEAMEEKIAKQREAEITQSLIQEGLEPSVEEDEDADEEQGSEEEADPIVDEVPEEVPAVEETETPPADYADDPLAEFIVEDVDNNNALMFVTKVDGKEVYIPLEKARQQLQKHTAAEARLQEAAEEKKRLDAREARILVSEQALNAKLQTQNSPPSPPPAQDVSDQDLENEAQGIVSSLFSGTESEAVEQLAKALKSSRSPQGQQVDPSEIARQATAAARSQLAQEAEVEDATKGLKTFKVSYPDITADEALFNYADGMTDAIAAEWKEEGRAFRTSEVMMEAGKRTEAWVQSMKTPAGTPTPKPKTDRHARKRNLRPMPTSHSQKLPAEQEEAPQTPQSVVAEMRAARGQA